LIGCGIPAEDKPDRRIIALIVQLLFVCPQGAIQLFGSQPGYFE
jgi:hypothetical protein